ncbi:HD domain-containing protein [Nocardia seriolae]|nr:HD domain-containing protein [Nocardia seriolae]
MHGIDDHPGGTMAVRLAELVAGLSLVSDLGKGLSDGQALRVCTVSARVAELLELPAADRETLYWVALLRFVGCTATASEMAAALGDELAVSAAFADADVRDLRDVLRRAVAVTGPRPDRVLGFLAKAPTVIEAHETASCEVARSVAIQLGLPGSVIEALGDVFERYDGKGNPGRGKGSELPLAVRVWQVAHTADLLVEHFGPEIAAARLRDRAGTALDPDIAVAVAAHCATLFDPPPTGSLADVLAAEPVPRQFVEPDRLDAVLGVFGLLADLKSAHFYGHSPRVAELAARAATVAGLPEAEVNRVRRAGLVHDIGKVAVSSRIWDCGGALSDMQREQVELHPYYTQRVLARVPALADLMDLACSHHEKSDGSGYHRRISGPALSPAAALLAAADCYVTAGEPRPHRATRDPADCAALLRGLAAEGRLPEPAVRAVLTAAGHSTQRSARSPGALTARETAVLQLIAHGLTNQAAARRLGISAKTVGTHLEHIYTKLGVSTRASAVVHATRLGWLDPLSS